ncbi:MAG TPA: DUF1194 domain-containing protein [Falsiroseomonas sp.]|jgi:hypothetical protein|nr:DUF1194 domain-containing protein [Falsiroseomonas sp.]
MRRRTLAAAVSALLARPSRAQPARTALPPEEPAAADLSLVLATDVSSSIDDDELLLQRRGYAAALTGPATLRLIAAGSEGAIGVAYVEWSGLVFQRLLLPWTRISGGTGAAAWGAALERQALPPMAVRRGTSISGGIGFSMRVLDAVPWKARRRVIDICGDGVNNHGRAVEELRDIAVAKGITLNGLAIEGGSTNETGVVPPVTLSAYYLGSVIGGHRRPWRLRARGDRL